MFIVVEIPFGMVTDPPTGRRPRNPAVPVPQDFAPQEAFIATTQGNTRDSRLNPMGMREGVTMSTFDRVIYPREDQARTIADDYAQKWPTRMFGVFALGSISVVQPTEPPPVIHKRINEAGELVLV
jgi:hypothetical protein